MVCEVEGMLFVSVGSSSLGGTMGIGGGARISGTGPEKSFPVIRESVFISKERYQRDFSGKCRGWLTDRDTIIETVIDSCVIPLVLHFEFILARFPITARQDICNKFIILPILRKGLEIVQALCGLGPEENIYLIEKFCFFCAPP